MTKNTTAEPLSTYATYSDEQLVALMRTGDDRVFDEVFHRYNRRLFPYIVKIIKSREAAEEIIHDVFVKLWNNRVDVSNMDNPTAWLFTVASNLSLDYLKKATSQKRIFDHLRKQNSLQVIHTENALSDRENERELSLAISKLSPKKQQIYRMSREQGMSHAEIAEKLNISSSTVNNHLVAALDVLRTNLKKAGILLAFFYFF